MKKVEIKRFEGYRDLREITYTSQKRINRPYHTRGSDSQVTSLSVSIQEIASCSSSLPRKPKTPTAANS